MNFIIVVCIDHNNKHSSALREEEMRIIQICSMQGRYAKLQNFLNSQCSILSQKLMVLTIKPYKYINLK